MKTAAIWWRVSKDEQREISPDTQTGEALAFAEQEGYSVPPENIIGTDWSSLSVWNSPTMDQLKALVLDRAITAIFMYDADRGPAKSAHRLIFRALCEENGVAVRCRYGEIPGGEMGDLMEFISAWSKENQVRHAQQRAKEGLRDRAKKRGLPTNGTAPLGYQFRYQGLNAKRIPVALEADSNYPVTQMIWRLALEGCPMRRISTELSAQGIPSPKGGAYWNPSTVAGILNNPVYGGRYYSLRETAIIPVQRHKVDPTDRRPNHSLSTLGIGWRISLLCPPSSPETTGRLCDGGWPGTKPMPPATPSAPIGFGECCSAPKTAGVW